MHGLGNIDFTKYKLSDYFTNYAIFNFKKLYNICNLSTQEKIDILTKLWIVDKPIVSDNSYLCMKDTNSKYITIVNGSRTYANQQLHENKVYLFGSSKIFGLGNDNEHCCSYYLQNMLNNITVYNCSCIDESLINVYYRIINSNIHDSVIVLNLNLNIIQYYLEFSTQILDLALRDIQELYNTYIYRITQYCNKRNNKLVLFCENYCNKKPNVMRLSGNIWKDTEYFDRLKLLNKIPKVNEIILSDDCFFDFCHTNPKGQMLIAKHIKELIDNEIFTVIPLYNSPTYYTIEELFTRSLLSTWKKQANVMDRINRYSAYLKSFNTNGTAGLLMVTCNPVTNGHLYIIEKLASQLDVLYIHIGDGDFYFPFDVRYRMLNDSIKHLSNVILLKPSNKLLSNKIIWHNYLYKEELNDIADVRKLINFDSYAEFMFNLLVNNLKITHLCWGNEDKDKVTDCYNQDMQKYSYGKVKCLTVNRIDNISGTKCRELFKAGDFEGLKHHMSNTCIEVLREYYDNQSNLS